MAINGGGQLSSSINVFCMYGIFHRQSLEAAGETLCPFRMKMVDSPGSDLSIAGPVVGPADGPAGGPSSRGSGWEALALSLGKLGTQGVAVAGPLGCELGVGGILSLSQSPPSVRLVALGNQLACLP